MLIDKMANIGENFVKNKHFSVSLIANFSTFLLMSATLADDVVGRRDYNKVVGVIVFSLFSFLALYRLIYLGIKGK